jgi:hypothetical protein
MIDRLKRKEERRSWRHTSLVEQASSEYISFVQRPHYFFVFDHLLSPEERTGIIK